MIPRFCGAILGLFAFTVSVTAGLVVSNPPATVLSRSILAMFVFCVLGCAVGAAAQLVVGEHGRVERDRMKKRLMTGGGTSPADEGEPAVVDSQPQSPRS